MTQIPSHRVAEPGPVPADTNDPGGVNVDRAGCAITAPLPSPPKGRKPADTQE